MDTCNDWLPPSSQACPTVGVGANAYFMFIRFMYAKCAFLVYLYSWPLLTDISLRQTPCWNENLELVPAFLYSFWLTLYKTDIFLNQTHMPVLKVSILETVLFNRDFFCLCMQKTNNKKARSLLINQIIFHSQCNFLLFKQKGKNMFLPTKFNKKKNRGGVYLLNNSIFIVLFVAYFINMLYLLVSFIQQLASFSL